MKDDFFEYSTESKLIGSTECSAESDDRDWVPLSRAELSGIDRWWTIAKTYSFIGESMEGS